MNRSVLVYDDDTTKIGTIIGGMTHLADDVIGVPWGCEAAGAFFDAQFGGRPFAFVLVKDDAVHVGDAAVGRLLHGRGVAGLAGRLYAAVGGPFGQAVHDRRPADIDGTFPLGGGPSPRGVARPGLRGRRGRD